MGLQSGSKSGSGDGSHGASQVVELAIRDQSGSGDGSHGASQVVELQSGRVGLAVREPVR